MCCVKVALTKTFIVSLAVGLVRKKSTNFDSQMPNYLVAYCNARKRHLTLSTCELVTLTKGLTCYAIELRMF